MAFSSIFALRRRQWTRNFDVYLSIIVLAHGGASECDEADGNGYDVCHKKYNVCFGGVCVAQKFFAFAVHVT